MRRAVWVLVPSIVLSCSAEESAPPAESRASAPLVLRPESDLPALGVLGRPALLPGGRRVEARAEDTPGESDLWLVEPNGASAPLAPALGPDELPIALPDGRVVFVSGRTTVVSLWIVDPASGALTQVTNVGLVAGKPWHGFVPPPELEAQVDGAWLRYADGSGRRWRVELATGKAEVEVEP